MTFAVSEDLVGGNLNERWQQTDLGGQGKTH